MKNAHRIARDDYMSDKVFAEHLKFIQKNLDSVDEIALFAENGAFGYHPLDEEREHAKLMKKRIASYREIGVKSVGINLLCTIGHSETCLNWAPKAPMQTMVGIDGQVSYSCLCPNTEELHAYVAKRYALYAETEPDFIWIDDDYRIDNHGVAGPCYCDGCIAQFNRMFGFDFTFEALTAAVKAKDPEITEKWYLFWVDSYARLARVIEKAVHGVDSRIKIGEMTSSPESWMEELGAEMGRPGGGFYCDAVLNSMLTKMLHCEHQIDGYNKQVPDIQYELENFPYQELGKSMTLLRLECLLALTRGCNGVAYNLSMAASQKTMDLIRKNTPLFQKVTECTKDTVSRGVCSRIQQYWELGIPTTSNPNTSCATVIDEKMAEEYSKEQLTTLLSKSVFVIGKALPFLEKKGLLELCGVEMDVAYYSGVCEQYTDHPFNKGYVGRVDPFDINFYSQDDLTSSCVYGLKAAPGAEVLGTCSQLGKTSATYTIYENKLGGRVAVSTFFFPDFSKYEARRNLLLKTFDWLSHGTLPAIVEMHSRIVPSVREGEDGRMVCLLANMTYDPTETFTVLLRTKAVSAVVLTADGGEAPLPCEVTEDGLRVSCGSIAPFDAAIVVCR